MENQVILELKNINKYYGKKEDEHIVNDNVSFKINYNDVVGLIGESGCGKSTLAKIIVGLEESNSGEIFFENNFITKKNRKNFKNDIQIIFQNPINALDPKMNVIDIVSEPLLVNKEKNKEKIFEKVKEVLEYVKLEKSFYQRKPIQLSGGQCQRVAIARALVTYPKLLVCDEITSALDVTNQYNVINIIKEYSKKHKITIIFITHNIKLAKQLCNRLLIMKDGKIIEENSTEDIFNVPKQEYTKVLINI